MGEVQSATQPVDIRIVKNVDICRLSLKILLPLNTPETVGFLEFQCPSAFRVETVFEEVTTDTPGIVELSLFRVENGLLRLQRITTVIEGCQQIRHFNVREVISEDIDTVGFGLQLKSVRIWHRGRCEVERTVQAKIILKADEVAEGSFTETALVVGSLGLE